MQIQEAREGLEEEEAEASMRQSGFTGRRGRKRKEQVGAEIKTEDDSRLLMNSFSQVFCEPLVASPVTNSRYTTRHAKMVVHQHATLKHIISYGLEQSHLSASPRGPLEAMPRDSSHAPSRNHGRRTTEVSPQHADLRTLSTQETEKQHVGPASSLPEAVIGNTSGSENIPLGKLSAASNFFENKPEVSAPNQKQENLHQSQSFSLNLSQMAGLCNGATSNDSGVGVLVVNSSSVPVGEYRVMEEFAPILKAVLLRHGDIAANCSLRTIQSRSSFLDIVCAIVQKLQSSSLMSLAPVEISTMLAVVGDLELVRLEVGWLHRRLKEILDAMQLIKHTNTLKEEQEKKYSLMEKTKKELEALRGRVQWTENKLAEMEAEASKFGETVSDAKTKVAILYQRPLLADLL